MLFFSELKKIVFSITFIILLIGMIFMVVSQDVLNMKGEEQLEIPQIGQDYGIREKEVPEVIMPAALQSLYIEFCANNYSAYPIGFYKNIKLNEKEIGQMADIISTLTGVSVNELLENTKPENITAEEMMASIITLKDDVSYNEFLTYMEMVDDIIGGGSNYSDTYLIGNFGQVPITYEEAVDSYNLIKDTDHFTGAYARLFCDYILIVLSILSVFLAVSVCLKDKHGIHELIYTRKASSIRIILTRYVAIITAIMLPAIILSYISNISIWSMYSGMTLDYFAPLKYCVGWVLPSVMVASAVGMLLTELTNTPIAIIVQGLWWFIDMNIGVRSLKGGYPLFSLSPRHNILGNTQIFTDNFNNLVTNRLLFTGLALLMIIITVVIYQQKRRGKVNGFRKIKESFADMADSEN